MPHFCASDIIYWSQQQLEVKQNNQKNHVSDGVTKPGQQTASLFLTLGTSKDD